MSLILHLKPGRDIPITRGHPWIMSGAIARIEGSHQEDEATIVSSSGAFLARATVHPHSEIRARVFDTHPDARLDADGILERLTLAKNRRAKWMASSLAGAERIVFSESDGLPGLIIDRYGSVLVFQLLTAPWESRRDSLISALVSLYQPTTIWERSDVDVRRHERIEPRKGLAWGAPITAPVTFQEGDWTFLADVETGHKTGFYLDQSDNRRAVATWVRRLGAPRVLNVFAYTDTFGIAALTSGASSVLSIDSASSARDVAIQMHAINPAFDPARHEYRLGDAFDSLRELHNAGKQFDMIILDPPRLVPRQDKIKQGLRAYKDINLQACKLLAPDGVLFSFSCSGLVDRHLFGRVIEGAARDAKRPMQFLADLGQPPDHPRKPGFPESEYLKGVIAGV
jgi:23S rRNA (cytosine1962-C5)-methyltransferase